MFHESWCDIFDPRDGYARCTCDSIPDGADADPAPARMPSARWLNDTLHSLPGGGADERKTCV